MNFPSQNNPSNHHREASGIIKSHETPNPIAHPQGYGTQYTAHERSAGNIKSSQQNKTKKTNTAI